MPRRAFRNKIMKNGKISKMKIASAVCERGVRAQCASAAEAGSFGNKIKGSNVLPKAAATEDRRAAGSKQTSASVNKSHSPFAARQP